MARIILPIVLILLCVFGPIAIHYYRTFGLRRRELRPARNTIAGHAAYIYTENHHSAFIFMDWRGGAEKHVDKILQAINTFRLAHPDMVITSWSVHERSGFLGRRRTTGIWVNLYPRRGQAAE